MSVKSNLVSSGNLVQTPFVKVTIGEYTFGVYQKTNKGYVYPNYIESLDITKINGQVNQYSLIFNYPVVENADPNFFEKVFSKVQKSRKIVFSYGDATTPKFLYRNEQAIITNVKSRFKADGSVITYTVSAVSQSALANSGGYTFPSKTAKPSDVIKTMLYKSNDYYGLLSLFTGMKNQTAVLNYNLIPGNDVPVHLDMKTNISALEYLQYLVDSMTPTAASGSAKTSLFVLTYSDDTSDILGGSYFKIVETDTAKEHPEAYELDIGYPGNNYVYNFSVENDENYAIDFEYQNTLHPTDYVRRIGADGIETEVYAPVISSANEEHKTTEANKSWWSKVTQYPIKVGLDVKGVLRPALLMSYVRLNVYMFGQKHITSGLYIITKQVDHVGLNGYSTTLNMTRVGGDQ